MKLAPEHLTNYMFLTIFILIGSATFGVLVASFFFTGAAMMSAFALGPFALVTTVPAALAFAALVNLLVLAVPVWGLVGGWLFASAAGSSFKGAGNSLGITLFSDTHPIHVRVNELAEELNLPAIRWVGWFKGENINACAMGLSKEEAVIAFSKGAIEKLTKEELDAVMGHELAHVVNHDMQRMTLAFGIQKSLTWFLVFRNLKAFARWVFTPLSELEIMRFSRQREYWADAIGAVLTSPEAMAGALTKIKQDTAKPTKKQNKHAHFMLSASAHSFFDTHPSIQNRVKALQEGAYIQRLPRRGEVSSAAIEPTG